MNNVNLDEIKAKVKFFNEEYKRILKEFSDSEDHNEMLILADELDEAYKNRQELAGKYNIDIYALS